MLSAYPRSISILHAPCHIHWSTYAGSQPFHPPRSFALIVQSLSNDHKGVRLLWDSQFTSLERNETLTRHFEKPASSAEEERCIDGILNSVILNQFEELDSMTEVIVIAWIVDKRLLAYPFFGSFIIGAIIAVLVGIKTNSISTGAQVRECICGVIASVFCYVIWRLS